MTDSAMVVVELSGQSKDSSLVISACQLIQSHWPRYSTESLQQFILGNLCVGLMRENELVAHAALNLSGASQSPFASTGVDSAVVCFVVVHSGLRRSGIGRRVMQEVERAASHRGIAILTLQPDPEAIPFYRSLGYHHCRSMQHVSEQKCFEMLEGKQEALNRLSNLFAGRASKLQPAHAPPTTAGVWMKKAIIEEFPSFAAVKPPLQGWKSLDDRDWVGNVRGLPWQRQIGPSCGLCAVRMIREWCGLHSAVPPLSALGASLRCTVDGEVLENESMAQLMNEYARRLALPGELPFEVQIVECSFELLRAAFNQDTVVLIAYDRGPDEAPAQLSGHHAHWGLIIAISPSLQGGSAANLNSHPPDDELIVQHGASQMLLRTTWSQVSASNRQLQRVFGMDPSTELVTEFPVRLAGQMILVRRLLSARP